MTYKRQTARHTPSANCKPGCLSCPSTKRVHRGMCVSIKNVCKRPFIPCCTVTTRYLMLRPSSWLLCSCRRCFVKPGGCCCADGSVAAPTAVPVRAPNAGLDRPSQIEVDARKQARKAQVCPLPHSACLQAAAGWLRLTTVASPAGVLVHLGTVPGGEGRCSLQVEAACLHSSP